jgi:hypothetical protein
VAVATALVVTEILPHSMVAVVAERIIQVMNKVAQAIKELLS